MALVSSPAARQYATISGNTITLGAVANKADSFANSILNSAQFLDSSESSANGHKTHIAIRKISDSTNDDFELCEATYNTSGDTLTINTRLATSNGGASVTWSGTVVVSGAVTHKGFYPDSETILQSVTSRGTGDWGTFTVDHDTTTLTAGTTNYITITPKSDSSVLQITGALGLLLERDGTSGSSYSGTAQLHYKNSSSVDTVFGDAIQVGPVSLPTSDTNAQSPQSAAFVSELTQSNLNASGAWEIKPFIATLTTGTHISILDCSIRFAEVLRP